MYKPMPRSAIVSFLAALWLVTANAGGASTWFVRGGTAEFAAFLRETAGDGVKVVAVSDMAYMPFKTATNAVFFVLPDYSKGRETLPDLGAVNCANAQAAIDRGCRVYVENSLSVSPEARKLLSVELLGTRRMPFDLEYAEWNGDVLQARQSSYLPALPRFASQRSPARSFVDVSDCLGVHGVRRPGRHRLPLLVESQKGRMFTALTSFSRYDVKFMRPYSGWKAFYADFLFRIAKADKSRAERAFTSVYRDFMRPSGGEDPKSLVRKAVEWHLKSGILREPGGTNGMYEAVLSDTLGFRTGLRGDSHFITASLFTAAGRKYGRDDWTEIGKNLADFALRRGMQTKDGFIRWFDKETPGYAGHTVYSSDMGRSSLALFNLYKTTREPRYLDAARKAGDAFLMWMDGRGLNSGHFDKVDDGGWKGKRTNNNPVFYGEMVPFLLQLGEELGERRYSDAALLAVEKIMEKFPNVTPFGYSDNFTYCRFLLMLACAQRVPGRDYSKAINHVLDFFARHARPCGGIEEAPIRLLDDDEASVGFGDGSDHIADLLYCNNILFNALSVVMKLPPERSAGVDAGKARRLYAGLRDFLMKTQISSADPKFDGAWMRAYDMDIDEYYGLDKDKGWGAYCIETGWMTGYIPLVFMYEDEPGSYFFRGAAAHLPQPEASRPSSALRSSGDELDEICARCERELVGEVVPFWLKHSIDERDGGFITCLDRHGTPYDTFKHLWMQWREVYMFAALWNAGYREPAYLKVAEDGFRTLFAKARRNDGSYHYLMTRDWQVLSDVDGGQEVFTESFVAVAAAELYRATKKPEYRDESLSAYGIYRRNTSAGSGKYDLLAYPMIELNVLQVLRGAFGGRDADIGRCIREIRRFAHPETGIMYERAPKAGGFELDTQFGRFVNPGHALEGLSFIMRRLMEKPDPELLAWTLKETKIMGEFGCDGVDGGIWYFRDGLGKPMSRHEYFLKAWWPQTEAANAMIMAYALSGESYFLDFYRKIDRFAHERLHDPQNGEWFAYAPVGGRAFHDYKGSRFKGFFHIPRHLLTVVQVVRQQIEKWNTEK